ncbi:MAG: DUF4957 domain-containing protein, partial [Bacteroidales bacterium]
KAAYREIVIDKSLTIKGEEGQPRPVVYLKRFDLAGTDINVHLEGIEFSGATVDSLTWIEDTVTLRGEYLLNLTTDLNSANVLSVKNCIIRNLTRSALRGDRKAYTVDTIMWDDCIFYDYRGGGDYGPFRTKSQITFNTFIVQNSTFHKMLNKLIDCQDIVSYPMKIFVENCTFYEWGGGKSGQYLFDIQDNDQAELYIHSCIFGKTNDDPNATPDPITVNGFRFLPEAYAEITNTAMTVDFVLTDSTYEEVGWDKTEYNLVDVEPGFAYPDTGNFTLPMGSDLLIMSPSGGIIGDPRWDPALVYIPQIPPAGTGMKVYPNPAFGFIHVVVEKQDVLSLYSSIGIKMKEYQVNSGLNTLDLEKLPPGFYFLRADSNKEKISKIIIR